MIQLHECLPITRYPKLGLFQKDFPFSTAPFEKLKKKWHSIPAYSKFDFWPIFTTVKQKFCIVT